MLSSLQQQINDLKRVALTTSDPTLIRLIDVIVANYDKAIELEDRIRDLENKADQQVMKVNLKNGAKKIINDKSSIDKTS